MPREHLVLFGDRLADEPGDLVRIDAVARGALDLLHDDELLLAALVRHREHRAAVWRQRRVGTLRR